MLTALLRPSAIRLDLDAATQDEVLAQLVALLRLEPTSAAMLQRMLKRRESLGSTGVGFGFAIPHTRCTLVSDLQLAFGRMPEGIAWSAIDDKPVRYFFVIVAPPLEVSNQYLPVLGRVAQFVKEPDVRQRLGALETPAELLALLREKGL
ncbi:MAG: PTS sugar transporter subunit IIA [Gemmatimonadales bacterium]|nr:PTS sugar transporter subunit IIA [Gemmatimonadales bacterium]